ncbi:MAG: tetratricopeptide repeat protein [Dongiaceae bacterium]
MQPGDLKSSMDRAVALHQAGKLAEADAAYRAIIAARPDFFHAHHLLGVLLMQQNQHQRALACVDEAIRIEPRFPDAYQSRGKILAELDRHDEAKESFSRALAAIDAALRATPRLAHGHFARGKMLEALGRPEEALASFETGLAIEPRHVAGLADCGTVLVALGREGDAIASYDAALALDPAYMPALFPRAKTLVRAGRHSAAMDDLDRVLALYPNHLDATVERAKLLRIFGDDDTAIAEFGRALALNPGFTRAKLALANLYVVQNRYVEAAAIYRAVLATFHDDGRDQEGTKIGNLLIGWSRLPPEHIDTDLMPWFAKAKPPAGVDPGNPDFQAHLAFAKAKLLHDRGDHDEAWLTVSLGNALKYREIGDPARRYRDIWRDAQARLEGAAPTLATTMRDDPKMPIWLFLFGASRSGKTTLETLAASLPDVQPGYENRLIEIARQRVAAESGLAPDTPIAEFASAERARFQATFDPMVRARAGAARVITCTLPGYIEMIPELAGLVPNLRFAFVRRDPDDNAFRIYMNLYKEERFRFAYDMRGIRDYLAFYDAMIDRLAASLPERSMVRHYEEIVADPAAARASLALLCGLPAPSDMPPALGDDRGCSLHYRAAMGAALTAAPDAALN